MSDPALVPVRKIALAFGGDAWMVPGTRLAPALTEDLPRIRCTGGPVRWTVQGYDGAGPDASPVVGDVTTVSTALAKIRTDRSGTETVCRTVPTGQVVTGEQLTEKDISASELAVISVVGAAVQGTAAYIWIFLDTGAVMVEV